MRSPEGVNFNPPPRFSDGAFDIDRDRLVFLHFEKTAGTTVKKCLMKLYEPHRICPSQGSDIGLWPSSRLRRYEFIACHANISDFRYVPEPWKMITFLRDPVDRCLSLYQFWSSFRDSYIEKNALPLPRLAKTLGLKRLFGESDYGQCGFLWNRYAEGLSGHRLLSPEGLPWRDETEIIEAALQNAEKMMFYGITENMAESFRRLSGVMRVRNFYRGDQENVTKKNFDNDPLMFDEKPFGEEIDKAAIDIVENANRLDILIYRQLAARFFKKPEVSRDVRCVFGHQIAFQIQDEHSENTDWVINHSAGFVTFGPGLALSRGQYSAIFRMRKLSRTHPEVDDVGFVDVTLDSGTRIVAQAPLRANDWPSDADRTVTVDFAVADYEPMVEFRTFARSDFSFEVCLDVRVSKRW